MVSTAVNQKISSPLAKNIFHASQTSEAAGIGLASFMLSKPGTKLDVAILGEWKVAEVIADSPYDPTSARARM